MGNVVPGDVGPKPNWFDSVYYHWVIESVAPKGAKHSPVKQNPVAACSAGDKNSYTTSWSTTSINLSESSTGGGIQAEGLSGNYSVTTSQSTSNELQKSMTVDCSKYDVPPGMKLAFYQYYSETDWTGRWDMYICGDFGCSVKNSGPASGIFYSPMNSTYQVLEPEA